MKKVIWIVACLAAGGAIWPISYHVLWAMRTNFIGEYRELKTDCERVAEVVVTADMENNPEVAFSAYPTLSETDYCVDLLTGMKTYKQAIFNRSFGFGIVLFIGLLIVRFVMFPFDDSPNWIENA